MPIPEHAPYGVWEFALPNGDKPVISRGNSENTNPISSDAVYSEFRHPAPVTKILENHLKRAMRTYASQPSIWIEPVIASRPETDRKDESATLIEYHQIYSPHPIDRLIISPPEYGLTCLARKLVLDSWRTHGALWLYIDCAHLKPNRAALQLAASEYANELGQNKSTFKFILLDGLNHNGISEANKMLELVASEFPLASLICTYSNQSGSLAEVLNSESLARKFQVCYLWALPRAKIRQIVSNYNTQKYIGDEDAVTARLVSDLEVLNLPRTPLNCLTLLKASEIDFEESPVNRSEVIKRVLFLLFSVDSIPTYKSRPDVKDCEYVLGYFCEQLIRSNTYGFARDIFLARIQSFCGERLINIDINLLFDILYQNSIIVSFGNSFQFRFSYWILYFAAHRMTHDESFKALIFAEMRYAQFPEIIEFYTGIDRKRDDALEQIEKDIKRVTQYVKDGTGLPADLNPYKLDIWKPSEKVEERMRQEVVNGIQESSLTAEFKDHYADRNYDRSKPYNQRITTLLSEASVFSLYQGLRAAGRALRNSDYVSPEIKRSLLAAIQEGWDEFAKVIFIVLPALALDGQAYYDGTRFFLQGNFGNTTEARANNILLRIPANVAEWFGSDVYSQKLSPLIYDRLLSGGGSAVSKHVLTLLLITYTPKGWEQKVSDYITAMKKNSFYLLDIYTALRAKYRYGFASPATLREINFLIKMTAAKHVTGDKSPGPKAIKSANLPDDVIPKRLAR